MDNEKIQVKYYIDKNIDSEGNEGEHKIKCICPRCGKTIYNGWNSANFCEGCGTRFDWGKRPPRLVVKEVIEL